MNQDPCKTKGNIRNFSCIANTDQLCALFQNSPTADKIKQRFTRTWAYSYWTFLLIHMHIHVAASQNVSSHPEDKCCKASDTQDICSTTAVYSRAIFESVPFALQKLFTSVSTDTLSDYFTSGVIPAVLDGTIEEICWTPPFPFCPNNKDAMAMVNLMHKVNDYNANMYSVQISCMQITIIYHYL